VPFVEALDAAIETARTQVIEQALRRFKGEIVGGKGLSAAMRSANNLFPLIVCDMVKIAEEGGRLDKALNSAAIYVERSADLRRKVMNAMLYPIVLSVIACGTIIVLVTFVAPRFADIFKKMGAKIPFATQLMLSVGTFIREHPFQVVGTVVGSFFLLRTFLRMPAVNKACAAFLLKVPVLGELLKRLAFSRAFQSIATLLASNVSMLSALDHGSKVAGNPVISQALLAARNSVEHGASLSDSLRDTRVFPPVLVRMVSVGERTGRLHLLMANTAAHMEEEVDGRLKALVSIVEPCMIVVMGCIVGAITMSIIVPLYSVVQSVH